MPIYKSVEFAIYCEACDNLLDFEQFKDKAEAVRHWRAKGWRIGKKCLCPEHTPARDPGGGGHGEA